MMDLLATLRRTGGIDALARQLDLAPAGASSAVEALLPPLLGGLRAYALARGGGHAGAGAVLAMIENFGDGDLAADIMGPQPVTSPAGDAIIVALFGEAPARERLADEVAQVSGREAALLDRVMPFLAMLLCGYVSARARAQGRNGQGLAWLRELLMLDEPDRALGKEGDNGE